MDKIGMLEKRLERLNKSAMPVVNVTYKNGCTERLDWLAAAMACIGAYETGDIVEVEGGCNELLKVFAGLETTEKG